jgi:enoyl-CoA hydratase
LPPPHFVSTDAIAGKQQWNDFELYKDFRIRADPFNLLNLAGAVLSAADLVLVVGVAAIKSAAVVRFRQFHLLHLFWRLMMTVRTEKNGAVWTIIHDRPEARNAMDPKSADALTAAFLDFDADKNASVAVFYGAGGAFCAGWDLKFVSTLNSEYPLGELDIPPTGPRRNGGEIPRGPLGPSRLELDKPVIAAIEGPAVAGGMELGLWCDFRVMAEGSYFGVYCRRWGVPLIDGGTIRLPRIVGQGRALEIILTGRKVPAEECLNIGLCEYVTPKGRAREKAEELAKEIARFPQTCVRADRRSVIKSHGLSVREALIQEWYNGREALIEDGVAGASRFKDGFGRHGDFARI